MTTSHPHTQMIPLPEVGRQFPNRDAAATYLRQHAHEHHYAVTTSDTRHTFISFKCYLGPTRLQKKILANAIKANSTPLPIIPSCPFELTARRDQKSHQFFIEKGHSNHDHPPSPERIPIEAYSRQRNQPETIQATNSKSFIQPPNFISKIASLPITSSAHPNDSNPYISHQYTTLFTQMQGLPTHTQTCLLARFLSECQLAEALTATTPSSNINPSNHQI